MAAVPEFKLILVSDGGVGKSTLLRSLICNEFQKCYVGQSPYNLLKPLRPFPHIDFLPLAATLGVEVYPLQFNTNFGCIQFNSWDTAGQEKYGGLRDGY